MENNIILPINENPIIKALNYNAHFFSILENPKICGELSASISDLKLTYLNNKSTKTDFSNYFWNIDTVRDDNKYNFYSDPYNANIHYCLASIENECCSIEFKLDYFQKSSPWSKICLFVSDVYKITEPHFIDIEYKHFIGYMNSKGIINNFEYSNDNTVENDNISLKLEIREHIKTYFSSDNKAWENISSIENDLKGKFLIGVQVMPHENNIYNWIFTNHIQLNDSEYGIDYFIGFPRNYDYFILNPFIPIQSIPFNDFVDVNIIESIMNLIKKGYYVEIPLNEYYIPSRHGYKEYYFEHLNLIYGFNYEEKIFNIMGYDTKPVFTTVSFDDLILSTNSFKNKSHSFVHLMKFKQSLIDYEFKIEVIIDFLKEYLYSKNSNYRIEYYYKPLNSKEKCGLNILSDIINNEESFKAFVDDIRISYILYEHKVVMLERIKFLYCREFINESEYKHFNKIYNEISSIAKKVMYKILYFQEKSVVPTKEKLIHYLKDLKAKETIVLKQLIEKLESL